MCAQFSGDAETSCILIKGSCSDLSLIVSSPAHISGMATVVLNEERSIGSLASGEINALFCLSGSIAYRDARQDRSGRTLRPKDTLLVSADQARGTVQPTNADSAQVVVLSWTSV
jgi:hypothetical protein